MSYVLLSDIHFNSWSAFSTTNEKGINSRLVIIIKELIRAAKEQSAKSAKDDGTGDRVMIIAGDVFHVRGKLEPSVLNPVIDTFKHITTTMGFQVYILAGNHDLENDVCTEVSSAITALRMPGVHIVNNPKYFPEIDVVMIPWRKSLSDLRADIENANQFKNADLVIHAPLNGVIQGMPENGLTPVELMKYDFNRVFCGHYHNHKNFDNRVFSIGATTQQTWGDVGSKAGFLLVSENLVEFRASHAPKFIDIDDDNYKDAPLICEGNYVRVKVRKTSSEDVEGARSELMDFGALNVVVTQINDSIVAERRDGSVKTTGVTIEQTIADFVVAKELAPCGEGALVNLCIDILESVEVVE